jgi:hypothetical protein
MVALSRAVTVALIWRARARFPVYWTIPRIAKVVALPSNTLTLLKDSNRTQTCSADEGQRIFAEGSGPCWLAA